MTKNSNQKTRRTAAAATMILSAALCASAQKSPPVKDSGITTQQAPITKSVSNIKNNLVFVEGPRGSLLCKSDGKPCTPDQIKDFSNYLNLRRSDTRNPSNPLAGKLNGLTVASDGTLRCETTDGKGCNASHLSGLNTVAASMRGANDPIGGVSVGLGNKKNPGSKM